MPSDPIIPIQLWPTVPFADTDAWFDWLYAHQLAHDLLAAQAGIGSVRLDELRRNPEPHGTHHIALSEALALGDRPDLLTVDLQDRVQYTLWMQLHANEHAILQGAV